MKGSNKSLALSALILALIPLMPSTIRSPLNGSHTAGSGAGLGRHPGLSPIERLEFNSNVNNQYRALSSGIEEEGLPTLESPKSVEKRIYRGPASAGTPDDSATCDTNQLKTQIANLTQTVTALTEKLDKQEKKVSKRSELRIERAERREARKERMEERKLEYEFARMEREQEMQERQMEYAFALSQQQFEMQRFQFQMQSYQWFQNNGGNSLFQNSSLFPVGTSFDFNPTFPSFMQTGFGNLVMPPLAI